MGWFFLSFLVAVGMTLFGLVYVSIQLRRHEKRVFCGVAYFLSALPIPILVMSLRLIAAIKGLKLES
jgi:uncharacterized membrane protein YiaA